MSLFNKWKQKNQIEMARKITEFVEKRVICSNHTTTCLTLDGKVKCTKLVQDDRASFDMGYGYTKFWKNINKIFLMEGEYDSFGSCLVGVNTSNQLYMTEKKDRTLGNDIKYLTSIKQIYSYPLSQFIFCLKEDGTVDSIPVRNMDLLTKVTQLKEEIQDIYLLKDVDEILYEYQYHQLIVRKKNGQLDATNTGYHSKFEEMKNWKHIKAMIPIWKHYVGLKMDGSIVLSSCYGKEDLYKDELNKLEKMKDIEQIVTLNENVIVLHRSGEVTFLTKEEKNLKNQFEAWNHIVKIYKRKNGYFYGLKSDGTVQAIQVNNSRFNIYFDVKEWRDIIGLSFERDWLVGIRKDGTLIACGNNDYGQCQVKDLKMYDSYEELKKLVH